MVVFQSIWNTGYQTYILVIKFNEKLFVAKPETVKRDWYVVDATGKTLGRLATELARRLRR